MLSQTHADDHMQSSCLSILIAAHRRLSQLSKAEDQDEEKKKEKKEETNLYEMKKQSHSFLNNQMKDAISKKRT